MIRIYLDANTSEALADALRREGFEVVRAQEVGLQDAEDITHLSWASEHGYVLFTFDAKTMPKAIDEWQANGERAFGSHHLRADAEGCGERDCKAVEECCTSSHQ
jgi:translation initiation factor IF-2